MVERRYVRAHDIDNRWLLRAILEAGGSLEKRKGGKGW